MSLTLTRMEWLLARRSGIGASDAPNVCGFGFSSPWVVWADKVGLTPLDRDDEDDDDDDRRRWGNRFENAVLDEFEDRTGYNVVQRGTFIRHATNPWMICTLDGVVEEHGTGIYLGVAEAKTTNGRDGSWRDGVPWKYVIQVQHQLEVTGLQRAWVPVLMMGGSKLKLEIHTIERDDGLIEMIMDMESFFWHHHVLAKRPPAVDGRSRTEEALRAAYPGEAGTTVELDPGALGLAREYLMASADETDAKGRKQGIKTQLQAMMGDAEMATVRGVTIAKWSVGSRRTLSADALARVYPDVAADERIYNAPTRTFTVPKVTKAKERKAR